MCTIAHDPLQNSNMVRAGGLQLKPGRWLQQNGAKASWISFGNYTNSKAFPSQSHWLCCENTSFQNLLTIDQSDQQEYVRRLVPHLSVRCLGPIVRESEHCFLSLLFCVCGSKFRHITLSLSVVCRVCCVLCVLCEFVCVVLCRAVSCCVV